jgi:hypothetical protein
MNVWNDTAPVLPIVQRVLNVWQGTTLSRRGMIWLLPQSPSHVSKRRTQAIQRKTDNLLTGEGEGAKFYHGEDAWFSINHAILSAIVQLEISQLSFPISVLSEVERRWFYILSLLPSLNVACVLVLWSRIHERTISLKFMGIILRVLRLEVSEYNSELQTISKPLLLKRVSEYNSELQTISKPLLLKRVGVKIRL